MAKLEIMNTVTRNIHRISFKFRKHSPEILVGAGIVGVIGSTIMACKATTKINDILDQTHERLDTVHRISENPELKPDTDEYKIEDSNKYITGVYLDAGWKMVKLYAPSVLIGTLSIAAILGGHNILKKRNIALAAAYATIDKSFKDYRSRVVEKFGEELDKELRYNLKAKEIEETVVDEKGKEETVTKTVNVVDPNTISDYARFFDDGCNGWSKNSSYNLMFLKDQQRYANDLLKTRGHLFLNEVYDALGIPRCPAGQIVGWIYDEKNPNGDNFVDFGIYDIYNEKNRDFVNGYEKTILLDFNVDGPIYDKI